MRFQTALPAILLALFFSLSISAQVNGNKIQKGTVMKTVRSEVVFAKPFVATPGIQESSKQEEREDMEEKDAPFNGPVRHFTDVVWQKTTTLATNSVTILNQFDVFNYTNVNPPDPSGDVGVDRVVTSTNGSSGTGGTKFAVYDKSGNLINASVSFNSITSPPLTGGSGDPVVLFDNLSNRWFISEMINGFFRIYVSQSSNPIGAFFRYIVPCTGTGIPDYPKYAIWNDKLIITTNQVVGNNNVYVLNRVDMIAGNPVTPIGFFTDRPSGFTLQNTVGADVDGSFNPDANSKPVLFRHRDDEINPGTPDNTKDFLEYFELDINFSTPASSTMSGPVRINIAEFDSHLCSLGIVGCFAQPGTTTRLTAINQMMMYRVQYRRFAAYESILMNFVTDVNGADLGGIRWCEVRKTTGTWFLYQEGTFAPADGLNRWMGTIAQDKFGNIALGYAVTSSTKFPSLRITGRKLNDPLGQMTEPEIEVATGSNRSNSTRWGDYFHLAIDPVTDENFWLNGMYSTGTQDWRTRVAHFKFSNCLNPFNSSAVTNQNATCFGGNNGTIAATPNGGTGPFTYQLNGGAPQSSNVFSNLTAGTYNITVNDNTGCSSIASATVTEPAQISIVETVQNVLCNASNNGTITVAASNTVGAVTYQLNSGTPQSSNVFNNLTAGTYTVTVRDGNNCNNQKLITVTEPEVLDAAGSKTDALCFGAFNGSITTTASGGSGNYQYKLNGGSFQASGSFTNLASGNYVVTINDANNCTLTRNFSIGQPVLLTYTAVPENVKCFGEFTGKITVSAAGGVGTLQYKLGNGALQNSNVFSNLAAGVYSVAVVDGNNCTTSQSITISTPSQLTATIASVNPSVVNKFLGSLLVNAAGGTPPYQYAINGGAFQTSNDFAGKFIIGTNTLSIKDANGCIITSTKLIELDVENNTWKSFSKIYPNPNQGAFYLEVRGLQTDNNLQIQIFDSKGAQMSRFETGLVTNGIFVKQLNFANLNAGVYTMKLVSKKTGDNLNIKFVVNQK
jgi:hypothetical protein